MIAKEIQTDMKEVILYHDERESNIKSEVTKHTKLFYTLKTTTQKDEGNKEINRKVKDDWKRKDKQTNKKEHNYNRECRYPPEGSQGF